MSKSVSRESKHTRLKTNYDNNSDLVKDKETDKSSLIQYFDSIEEQLNKDRNQKHSTNQAQSSNEFPHITGFEIEKLIGQGGMGAVYKAKDTKTDEFVAIKILHSDLIGDAASIKRFNQEAESARKLVHQNLVKIHGHGTSTDEIPYLVMEYIDGKSLRDLIKEEDFLSPERSINILAQICQGLSYAHQNGIIHRDIKPSNIIIEENETGNIQVKILDFGIALVRAQGGRETQDLTKTGDVLGSPQYMSPEQCLGFMLDERSDIYSLGCLMYEMLTGKPPFKGDNPVQLVVSHINEKAPQFSKEVRVGKKIKNLENIARRCLNKEQSDRYQTVDEIGQDLIQVSEGKPIAQFTSYDPHNSKMKVEHTISMAVAAYAAVIGAGMLAREYLNYDYIASFYGLLLVVTLVAVVVFFIPGELVKLNHFIDKKGTFRQWMQSFTHILLSLAGLSIIPYVVLSSMSGFYSIPVWADACSFIGIIAFTVLGLLTAASVLGYAAGFSSRKITGTLPVLAVVLFSTLIVSSTYYLAPKQFRSTTQNLCNSARRAYPDIAIAINDFNHKYLPEDKETRFESVYILKDEARDREAIEKLNTLFGNGYDLDILKNRSWSYFKTGQYKKAIADIDRIIELDPRGDANGYNLKARIYALKGDYKSAMDNLDKSIFINPSYSNKAYKIRIAINYKKGDLANAIAEQYKLSKLVFFKPEEFLRLAVLYENLGDKKNAMDYYKLTLEEFKKVDSDIKKKEGDYRNVRFYYNTCLIRAYAAMKTGDTKMYKEYLRKAKDKYKAGYYPDLIRQIYLKESGIKLDWPVIDKQ